MLQRLSRRTEVQPLLLLSVSDLLLALCWIIGASLYSRNHSAHTLCYQLHTVEQVLYMASFFYTLNFVFNLYRGIREQHYSCRDGYVQFSNRVSAAGKITAVLSGLSPVLLMTPVFIQGSLSQCETNFSEPYRCLLMHTGALFLTSEQQPIRACRLLHTYRSVLFLASFLLTLLSIIVLVRKSRRLYRRVVTSAGYLGNQQRACVHLMERRMLLFPLVFLLCWGPAVCLVCVRMVSPAAGQGVVGVVLYVSEVSLRSRGPQLALSGFPQLSSVRLDSSSSAPRDDDHLLSRRGHPDASAEISEEEKLPDPERPLRQEARVERSVSLRGKPHGSQRRHAPSHPETLRRGKEEEGDAGGETPTQKTGSEKDLTDGLFGFYLRSEKGVTFPPSSSLCVPADPPSRNCDARADLAHYGMQRGDTSPSPACCGRFARICRRTMHFLFNR
ncbi:hypothetical protein NQZ68_031926 [Dissostichus eleginoides]|nr:hypothetical protein NQZ68_031926 [Dissostichus eleginoides]